MKRALSEAFARYGMSVSVLHGGETAETKAFLQLSPDSCWSLPDLREFLESGKAISDYV